MKEPTLPALMLLLVVAIAACAPPGYYRRGYGPRVERRMTDRDAWEVVRADPCRYDEYRRFAEKHKNPDKRREVVWRLANEGCHRDAPDDYYDR